jgi:hypothetical protein
VCGPTALTNRPVMPIKASSPIGAGRWITSTPAKVESAFPLTLRVSALFGFTWAATRPGFA